MVGSIRHADVLLVTGIVTKKTKARVLEIYEQAPKPIIVIAIKRVPVPAVYLLPGTILPDH